MDFVTAFAPAATLVLRDSESKGLRLVGPNAGSSFPNISNPLDEPIVKVGIIVPTVLAGCIALIPLLLCCLLCGGCITLGLKGRHGGLGRTKEKLSNALDLEKSNGTNGIEGEPSNTGTGLNGDQPRGDVAAPNY